MKHSIRQRVLDPVTGLKVTKIETVNGELGSGVKDCNGVEIFEGDAVLLDNRLGVVRFDNAQFYIDRDGDEDVPFTLNRLCSPFIEVIGHIAKETT